MARELLLVGPAPPPSGGVASHVADLAAAAAALDVRVRLCDTSAPHLAARLPAALALARLRGAVVHLHTNGHNAGSWRVIALVGAMVGATGGRAVVTIHSGLAPGYVARHARRCCNAARRYCTVVAVSAAVAEALAGAGISCHRIKLAPAFSRRYFPQPAPPEGLDLMRSRHEPLLYAALGVGHEYGADLVVRGLARLVATHPHAGLFVAGPGAHAPSFRDALRAAALADRVHVAGDLDRAASLAVLGACDLFVRPTRADGDSVSVREALALGRRVVASDAARRPAGVRLFPTGDEDAFVSAMIAALATEPPAPSAEDGLATVLDVYRALFDGARAADRHAGEADPGPTAREAASVAAERA